MLHKKLCLLFPDFGSGDWELQDDGDGAYIRLWNRVEPQPAQAQLDAVTEADLLAHDFAAAKAMEIAYWKAEREKLIARMNSIQDQLEAIADTAGAASCRAVRQSLLGLFTDAAVTAATTMVDLKAGFKARYKVATDLATTSAKLEFLRYEQ